MMTDTKPVFLGFLSGFLAAMVLAHLNGLNSRPWRRRD